MRKVICVSGLSGVGKTTLCNILSQNLDVMHIVVDEIYKQTPFCCPNEFKQIYGQLSNAENIKQTLSLIKDGTVEKEMEYFTAVFSTVNSMIMKISEDFMQSDKRFLLLDWSAIAQTDLWKTADYKILVYSAKLQRHNALMEREIKKYHSFRSDLINVRDQIYGDAVKVAEKDANIILHNNYDASFYDYIKQISERIFKNRKNVETGNK